MTCNPATSSTFGRLFFVLFFFSFCILFRSQQRITDAATDVVIHFPEVWCWAIVRREGVQRRARLQSGSISTAAVGRHPVVLYYITLCTHGRGLVYDRNKNDTVSAKRLSPSLHVGTRIFYDARDRPGRLVEDAVTYRGTRRVVVSRVFNVDARPIPLFMTDRRLRRTLDNDVNKSSSAGT